LRAGFFTPLPPPNQLLGAPHALAIICAQDGGAKEDPCLRVIPDAVLEAMRPMAFVAAVDPTPWGEGLLMLPATSMLRAYQVQKRG